MKIVVVGATGFVGRNLVPLLRARGVELLLVGRDLDRIQSLFPDFATCTYEDLVVHAAGVDALLYLAVVNNDSDAEEEAFFDVNVRLMLDVAAIARTAGVGHFVLTSSTHALDEANLSPYAVSKREAARRLSAMEGLATTTVYLPAVYGDSWSGQLARLNKIPRPLAKVAFAALAAVKPTVHVSRLADFLMQPLTRRKDETVILADGQQRNLVYRIARRIVDLGFATTVLLLLWWLLLLVWVAIKLQSSGPAIFAQPRVGRDGKEFICYKFRTMQVGTAQLGTHEVASSSVTRIGAVLRRTKIDELPQILNIFRNEISLVGPRPCLPVQTQLLEARRRRGVLDLKPGITGMSQVRGIDMSDPERLANSDACYSAQQSLLLDLRIVIATAIGRGQGDRIR